MDWYRLLRESTIINWLIKDIRAIVSAHQPKMTNTLIINAHCTGIKKTTAAMKGGNSSWVKHRQRYERRQAVQHMLTLAEATVLQSQRLTEHTKYVHSLVMCANDVCNKYM